jgi:hypothetical protein
MVYPSPFPYNVYILLNSHTAYISRGGSCAPSLQSLLWVSTTHISNLSTFTNFCACLLVPLPSNHAPSPTKCVTSITNGKVKKSTNWLLQSATPDLQQGGRNSQSNFSTPHHTPIHFHKTPQRAYTFTPLKRSVSLSQYEGIRPYDSHDLTILTSCQFRLTAHRRQLPRFLRALPTPTVHPSPRLVLITSRESDIKPPSRWLSERSSLCLGSSVRTPLNLQHLQPADLCRTDTVPGLPPCSHGADSSRHNPTLYVVRQHPHSPATANTLPPQHYS